jgi:hypothetical protein
MNKYLLIPVLFFFVYCGSETNGQRNARKGTSFLKYEKLKEESDSTFIDSLATGLNFSPDGEYVTVKKEIETTRLHFQQRYFSTSDSITKKQVEDSARAYLTNAILNKLVPFWYGTRWDFNGYTEKPGTGTIACGYFVSTTLKHAGIRINRFKMAQQAGYHEALTIEPDSDLLIIDNQANMDINVITRKLLNELKDGLYFIGLSCHVGYLYIHKRILYFLHSNYIDGIVMIEKAAYSDAFRSSIYVVADITHNQRLIKHWISGEEIPVVMP